MFRDFEGVGASARRFAAAMQLSREHLGVVRKLYVPRQKCLWHLDAIDTYCGAVRSLRDDIRGLDPKSRGLAGLGAHLDRCARSDGFGRLTETVAALKAELAAIRYGTLIRGDRLTVRRYTGGADYSAAVEGTFERFKRGAANDY